MQGLAGAAVEQVDGDAGLVAGISVGVTAACTPVGPHRDEHPTIVSGRRIGQLPEIIAPPEFAARTVLGGDGHDGGGAGVVVVIILGAPPQRRRAAPGDHRPVRQHGRRKVGAVPHRRRPQVRAIGGGVGGEVTVVGVHVRLGPVVRQDHRHPETPLG